jgi:hypothetical protein
MGFALRWGGWRMVVAIAVENGIRIAIPASIAGAGAAGAWLSHELTSDSIDLGSGATATPLNLNQIQLDDFQNTVTNTLLRELDFSEQNRHL